MDSYSGVLPFLISLFSYIIFGPFFLLFFLVNEIFRLAVSIYLELKYCGEVWLVPDGNDGIWATTSPGKSRMIMSTSRYKGNIYPETIINTYTDKIRHDRDSEGNLAYIKCEYILLQQSGYACWKRDRNFNIKNHVRTLDGKVYDKEDLKDLFKELEQEMEPSRPQWECVIVPRYKEQGEVEETGWMIFRFNHAYMDGISLIMLMKRFFMSNFTYYLDPQNFKIPSWKKFLFYVNAVIFGPHTVLVILKSKFKEYWPCLPSTEVSNIERHYSWTGAVSLDYIRMIRNVTEKTTIMSIVQNAFISAAIQVLPKRRIPDQWVIGELAALLPYEEYKPQNRFTGFIYEINSLEDDFTRLRNSKKAAWEGMTGPFIPLLYAMFYIVGRLPLFLHRFMLQGACSTIFFSNVPVSKTKAQGLNNVEILEMFGFPPQANDTGITLMSSSYCNSVKVAASAQSNWLRKEELDEIVEKIPDIIEEWAKASTSVKTTDKINLTQ